jgi:hypothetical protein
MKGLMLRSSGLVLKLAQTFAYWLGLKGKGDPPVIMRRMRMP